MGDIIEVEVQRKRMAAVQCAEALRIASSYGTVSEPVALVVVGVISIDRLESERKYERQGAISRSQAKAEAGQRPMQLWRER